MPPTKPTLPVLLASAAAMPTRKLPSCSLNTTDWTLGLSTTESMITNFLSGNSAEIVSSGVEKPKPTATTMSARCAIRRSAWSRWLSLVISNSR